MILNNRVFHSYWTRTILVKTQNLRVLVTTMKSMHPHIQVFACIKELQVLKLETVDIMNAVYCCTLNLQHGTTFWSIHSMFSEAVTKYLQCILKRSNWQMAELTVPDIYENISYIYLPGDRSVTCFHQTGQKISNRLTLGGCSPYTDTCGMGPGNRLVSTQYLATLDSATAVPTRRSAGVPVCLWRAAGCVASWYIKIALRILNTFKESAFSVTCQTDWRELVLAQRVVRSSSCHTALNEDSTT